MNSDYLYEFVVLASTMNFSRAAEKLFITQSTLSRHIKELEAELGEPLFVRDSHSVELTAKGHLFIHEATKLDAEFSKIMNRFRNAAPVSGRRIRIACASTSFGRSLREFLADFEQRNSQYTLEVGIYPDQNLDQLAQGCDLLFSPFEYHTPFGMSKQEPVLTESSSLASNMRSSSIENMGTLASYLSNSLLVPYIDELFCSYAYHKQYIERMTGNRVHIIPVPNVETALLHVQWERGIAIVPRHMAVQTFPDVLFSSTHDSNLRFSTYLYAKEALDYEFIDSFVNDLMAFQHSKQEKTEA